MSAILSGDPFMVATASPVPPGEAVAFTRKGYGALLRSDGTLISRHSVAEEAYERSMREGAGVYRWVPPVVEIKVP